MFIDTACAQKKKYNQNAYGDCFLSSRYPELNRVIAVLSDGLGSGIKVNILAGMTASMLKKFIEADADIEKSCEIMMNSLPVCRVRGISYATFSAIDCYDDGSAQIIEEGNPDFIWIRDNEVLKPDFYTIQSKTFKNRIMKIYKIQLQINDRLIFCSDGATQAALGAKKYPFGLERSGLIKIILKKLEENSAVSSNDLAAYLLHQIELIVPDRKLKDDTSIVSLYCRAPRESLIFTGPPYFSDKDKYYAEAFINFKGKKAVSGGTTANILSRELGIPVKSDASLSLGGLPGTYKMEGIDLVTEGILTLTKTLEYLETGKTNDDAALKLMNFMLDSDCITFMTGAQVNQAHYNPNLPIEIEIRKNIVKKTAKILQDKYLKKVTVQFI